MVELLVVIGIIAALISILLPSLGRAREAAKQAYCLSNIRQIGMAMITYADVNRGWFPSTSGEGEPIVSSDWLFWQPGRDPTESSIATYMGGFKAEMFRCPSDNLDFRARDLGHGTYRYSYTMNYMFSSSYAPPTARVKVANVRNPSEKFILAEEDETTADDGAFHPTMFILYPPLGNQIATRHDGHRQTMASRGNVACADGHAEYVTREYARQAAHYDPTIP